MHPFDLSPNASFSLGMWDYKAEADAFFRGAITRQTRPMVEEQGGVRTRLLKMWVETKCQNPNISHDDSQLLIFSCYIKTTITYDFQMFPLDPQPKAVLRIRDCTYCASNLLVATHWIGQERLRVWRAASRTRGFCAKAGRCIGIAMYCTSY